MEDEDGQWSLEANGSVYIIADVGGPDVPWGADQAAFAFGEARCPEWDMTQYQCVTGLQSWAVTLPDERKLYNLSIPAPFRSRFASLSVQPLYITQDEVNLTVGMPTHVIFEASGDIAILLWSMMNFSDLAAELDGAVLKRNTYAERIEYPCVLVAGVTFESEFLYFPARVAPGTHELTLWGANDMLFCTIVSDTGDFDQDQLSDREEIMSGNPLLTPRWANAWGYHVVEEQHEEVPLEQIVEQGYVEGAWVHESELFYVPESYANIHPALTLWASGRFANITVDQDLVNNKTLQGYVSDSDEIMTATSAKGEQVTGPAYIFNSPDEMFGGYMEPGAHRVAYVVYRSPLEDPELTLFVDAYQVPILGTETKLESDYDNDTVPDSLDLSPSGAIQWQADSLLQLPVPCNKAAGEDVEIKVQVLRPPNDRTTEEPLDWHGTEGAHRKVHIRPVLILYGPGPRSPASGQVPFWNNRDGLAAFLRNTTAPWPVDSYKLVDVDANGYLFSDNGLLNQGDPLPQAGEDAYDYQQIIFPQLAEKVMEFSLFCASDAPAIQNDGIIDLRIRFAYAIVDEAWHDPADLSILGWYDLESVLVVSGVKVTFLSQVNALLGQPQDAATHNALWYYNQNPALALQADAEFYRAIVTQITGAHFLPQYNLRVEDPQTWGIMERLNNARNATPWDGQSAETTYLTLTSRTLDLLSKVNQSVHYDLTSGEQYANFPAMFDFASCQPDAPYLTPGTGTIPQWSYRGGSGYAWARRNVQVRASVLELVPSGDTLSIQADRGSANATGSAKFSLWLESPSSQLEVQLGLGAYPNAIGLVAGGEWLQVRDGSGSLRRICRVWPREWFDVEIRFEDGTYDILVGGVTAYAETNLSYWHVTSEIQTITFEATGGATCIDAVGLYWGAPDPSETGIQINYESVHFGDMTQRVSWYEISDIYNGSYGIGDPQLQGDETILYSTYYSGLQHAMERVRVHDWPVALRLVHADTAPYDGFNVDNFLNVTFAQGTFFPATDRPGQVGTSHAWRGRDVPQTAVFHHVLLNEWEGNAPTEGPATVSLDLGDIEREEMDWRIGEVDPWEALHAPTSSSRTEIAVEGNVKIIIETLFHIQRIVRRILDRIDQMPDFNIEDDHDSWGKFLFNPFGWVVKQVEDLRILCTIHGEITKETLRQACLKYLVAFYKLMEIITAEPGTELDLLRFVQIDATKFEKIYPRAQYPEYWELEKGTWRPSRKLQQEFVDSLPQDVLIIESAQRGRGIKMGRGTTPAYYVRLVRVVVRAGDRLNAIIGFATACDLFHVWGPAEPATLVNNAKLHRGVSREELILGVTGDFVNGQELPDPNTCAKHWDYPIYTLKFTLMIDGEIKEVKMEIFYWIEEGETEGFWCLRPIVPYDPQNIANALHPNSELGGAKGIWLLHKVIRTQLQIALDWLKDNNVISQVLNDLKEDLEELNKLLQEIGRHITEDKDEGVLKNLETQTVSESRFLAMHTFLVDLYNLFKGNDLYIELPPQLAAALKETLPTEKLDFGTLTATESRKKIWIVWSKNPAMRIWMYKPEFWRENTPPQLAAILFKFGIADSDAWRQELEKEAQRTGRNWQTCWDAADDILRRFLELMVRSGLLQDLANHPDNILKIVALVKDAMQAIENALPPGPIKDLWVKFRNYGLHNIEKVSDKPHQLLHGGMISFTRLFVAIISKLTGLDAQTIKKWLKDQNLPPLPPELLDKVKGGEVSLPSLIEQLTPRRSGPPGPGGWDVGVNPLFPSRRDRILQQIKQIYLDWLKYLRDRVKSAKEKLKNLLVLHAEDENLTRLLAETEKIWGLISAEDFLARASAAVLIDEALERLGEIEGIPAVQVLVNPPAGQQLQVVSVGIGGFEFAEAGMAPGAPLPGMGGPPSETPGFYLAETPSDPNFFDAVTFMDHADDVADYSPSTAHLMNDINTEYVTQLDEKGVFDPKKMGDLSDPAKSQDPNVLLEIRRMAKAAIVLCIISFGFQIYNLITHYEEGAPIYVLAMDWTLMALTAIQLGVSIASLTTWGATMAGLTLLGTLSSIPTFATMFLGIFQVWQLTLQNLELPKLMSEQFKSVALIKFNPCFNTAVLNHTLTRGGGLRQGDIIPLGAWVENTGESDRYTDDLVWGPGVNYSSPFWIRTRYAAAGPGTDPTTEDLWTDWGGYWEGPPIYEQRDYYTFYINEYGNRILGPLYTSIPATPPQYYEVPVTLTQATSELCLYTKAEVATTVNGRTNNTLPEERVVMGDTNNDGVIDPLFEQGLAVLEPTLERFLEACINTTPAISLDALIHNYTAATNQYQWADAADYISQILTSAQDQAVLPETLYNATVSRYQNFTGTNPTYTTRPWGSTAWTTSPVPASVSTNYYLFQASSCAEWVSLLGGTRGEELINAGWRPLQYANYPNGTTYLLKENFTRYALDSVPSGWTTYESPDWFWLHDASVKERRGEHALVLYDADSGGRVEATRSFDPMIEGRMFLEFEYDLTDPECNDQANFFLQLDGGGQPVVQIEVKNAFPGILDCTQIYANGLRIVDAYYPGVSHTPIIIEWDATTRMARVGLGSTIYDVPFLPSNAACVDKFTFGTRDSAGSFTNALEAILYSLLMWHLDERGPVLNAFGLSSSPGTLLVPRAWEDQARRAFIVTKTYEDVQLPCRTNIHADYSWGTAIPVIRANETFTGTINFAYAGTDNPLVSYALTGPTGWDVAYNPRHVPLKTLLQVSFTLEAPPDAPAGTYYLDFIERRADGSSMSGNVTFACRIPIRVRYNATWALDMAGLPDLLVPGTAYSWATLFNGGTAPQHLYITGDGIPLEWMAADGYAPLARWDFNRGSGGWIPAGPSSGTFEADPVPLSQMAVAKELYPDQPPYGTSFSANRYFESFLGRWVHERTYFAVPPAAPTYASPVSATVYEYLGSTTVSNPSPVLVISPATGQFSPETLTWSNQPGFDGNRHAWAVTAANLPASGWVAIPNLAFGETYVAWVEESGEARVSGYGASGGLGAYMLHLYNKVAADDTCLVLQSNANEVVKAAKNVSAQVLPGDRIRITYENAGATGAILGAWDSFALAGIGRQERVFIADGFYTLTNLTVSARVAPSASFRVEAISLERPLTRHLPLAEFAFSEDTSFLAPTGWSASFGSGTSDLWLRAPIINATRVTSFGTDYNYNTQALYATVIVTETGIETEASYVEVPLAEEVAGAFGYQAFAGTGRYLRVNPLIISGSMDSFTAFACGAFEEDSLTYSSQPLVEPSLSSNLSYWTHSPFPYFPPFFGWDLSASPGRYFYINTSVPGTSLGASDDEDPSLASRPSALFQVPKAGMAGGAFLLQSDTTETFQITHALAEPGQNLTLNAGDNVWASFETTSAGGATLVLVNADPAGADLVFTLATVADQNRETIMRELVIPTGGNYTTLLISGELGPAQNFSLSFVGVYKYQSHGSSLAASNIGGYYNENILTTNFVTHAPLAGGSFTFDGSTNGFAGDGVKSQAGSLVLAPTSPATLTATCVLAGLVLPANTRARARFNSTIASGVTCTFTLGGYDLVWNLSPAVLGTWQEVTLDLPEGIMLIKITLNGDFAEHEAFLLDYLVLEAPATAPCVMPELAGRRDVLALKNTAACGGTATYTFPSPQTRGRLDFCVYAPGTNATLAITLEGNNGENIYLEIADWQLWLGNLTGAIAAAGIYGGWHSLSVAWDCANHNYTVWYFNQTLLVANYTAGWGILNFTASAITGVRFGMADDRSTYYLDGVYFDPEPVWPSNQSLVETFRAGGGIYVDLQPGEEWSLQFMAPPRSPLTTPGTYPVHLAIYDASTGQLMGLVHKDVTVPEFYDCSIVATTPLLRGEAGATDYMFSFTLTNGGNILQDFVLSTSGVTGYCSSATFYADLGAGTPEEVTHLALAPGESRAFEMRVAGASTQRCDFEVIAASSFNSTTIPGTFVCNEYPHPSGSRTEWAEWGPQVEVNATFWDDQIYSPEARVFWHVGAGPMHVLEGAWASGVPISVVINASDLPGPGQAIVTIEVYDGFPKVPLGEMPPWYYTWPYITQATMSITLNTYNNLLPVVTGPANITASWADPLPALEWTVTDGATWAGWQDDFAGFYGAPLASNWTLVYPATPPAGIIKQEGGALKVSYPGFAYIACPSAWVPALAGTFGFETEIISASNEAGIVVADPVYSEANLLRLFVTPYGTGWQVVAEARGGTIGDVHTPRLTQQPRFLRVARVGPARWEAWYSYDDLSWTCLSRDITWTPPAGIQCGLWARGDAAFDWARLTSLQPVSGATYSLYRDGSLLQQGEWASFQRVAASLEALRALGAGAIGTHEFTLIVTDVLGGTSNSTSHVTITQVTPVLSAPADFSCVEGTAPTITWDIYDQWANNPPYDIYLGILGQPGTKIATGTWMSGNLITATLPPLTPGTHACRFVATNDLGGMSEDRVIITAVQATLVPPPDVSSSDFPAGTGQIMSMESPALTLDVHLDATAPVTLVASTWDGNPATGTLPEMAARGAFFALEADQESAITFPMSVTVTFPWDGGYGYSPEELAGCTGVYLYNEVTGTWELCDATVTHVNIHGTLAGTFVDVTLAVPHLSVFAVGIVNLPPILTTPADTAYLGGSIGNCITWQVTDNTTLSPTFNITRDSLVVASGAWPVDGIITLNVDGLGPGSHNFILTVDDGKQAPRSDSVLVVVDNFAPTVSAPLDLAYVWGTAGHFITWHVTDETAQGPTYSLAQDGLLVASGAWPSGHVITWNVDGLGVGTYRFNLQLSDGLGSSTTDEVRVTVLNTDSTLSAPPDHTSEYGSLAPALAWTVADGTVLAGTYTITLAGFPVLQGTWGTGDTITWMPFDLLPGTWTVVLAVEDGYGGKTYDSLSLTVTNAPPAIAGPHSAVFEAGNASAGAWVTITDPSAASDAAYSIFRDGTRVASGHWSNGDSIYVNFTYTPPGSYAIEIRAWDGLGGVTSHHLLATTTNMVPVITAPAPVTFEAGTAAPVLNWIITDESAENATYSLAFNGITIANNTWVSGDIISVPVGTWLPGTFNVTLSAADGWGAVAENSTLVVVTNAAPVVLAPLALSYEAGDPRPVVSFVVTDISTRDPTYTAYLNETLVASGTWAPGIPVTIPAGGIASGFYILTLVAQDGYGAAGTGETLVTAWPDDDTTCEVANLTCSATPARVTLSFDLGDPSGYASLDWVALNGTLIPLGNLSATVNGTRATISFNHTFAASGTYALQFQLTDGDNDWPGDGTVGVFTCTFAIHLEDAVETLLGTILSQIDAFIATARGIDERAWRNLIISAATRARNDVASALAFYHAGLASKALTRVRVARALAGVADILVEVGHKVTHSHNPVWGELHAQAGVIKANLASAIHLLEAAQPHGHPCHGRCGRCS